jgi:hypothetical protein
LRLQPAPGLKSWRDRPIGHTGATPMIPVSSHPAWVKLIKGELKYQFASATTGLLFFNLRNAYQRNPGTLSEQIERARTFFQKYEKVLAADIARIFHN